MANTLSFPSLLAKLPLLEKLIMRSSAMTIGAASSVMLHLLVLALGFTMPEMPQARTPSLDVILVNARHATAPRNAQALAQANLDGGGNSDEDVRATSPLPPQESTREGSDLADMTRGLQAATRPQQTEDVLTQENSPVAIARTEAAPDKKQASRPVAGEDDMDAAAMALQIAAEIDAQTRAYNQRPRRKTIGARTEEYRFAQYIEAWRAKAERIGDLNYPAAARGRLYDSLLMTVSIKKDGTIEKVVINRPSKFQVLNDAAERIVRLGEPYAPFPPNIARDIDVLDITRTWTFTNGKLSTK